MIESFCAFWAICSIINASIASEHDAMLYEDEKHLALKSNGSVPLMILSGPFGLGKVIARIYVLSRGPRVK